ncbi:MAG TPA: stalk domain-containing protein [Symbiobacteriaceae bacterium]|nr:stalk domain-containing protein [Symbiobacteriaceae bacterium]
MRPRNRFLALLATLLLLLPLAPVTRADEATHPVSIRVDGRPVTFPDAQPLMSNSRILVPVRFVSEALGAQVGWDDQARTATITQGARYVRLYPTEACGLTDCNGPTLAEQQNRLACLRADCTEAMLIDVAPRIVGSRTYVPLRFVAEALGAKVDWDGERTVDLTSGQGAGFSTATVQITGLPANGQIDAPTPLSIVRTDPATGRSIPHESDSLVQLFAIDPATRQGYLLGAASSTATPLTINSHAVPPGRYLVAAGLWTVDRWLYSLPQLITFTGTGTPWSGDRTAWLSGYPDSLIYRYEMEVSALAYFPRSQVRWLYDGVPQAQHDLTFRRTFTPADNGAHTLKARLTPADGGPVVETDQIRFQVDASPIQLAAPGRDQVITAVLPVGVTTSEAFAQVEYRVLNERGTVVARQRQPIDQSFQLDPAVIGEGAFTLAATGYRADGSTAAAAVLPFYAWPGGEPVLAPTATPAQQQAFLNLYEPIAMAIYAQTGLSPSLQLAQAIHESGWGMAEATDLQTGARSFNLFGLKAIGADPYVRQVTMEVEGGQQTFFLQRFKRFADAPQAWQARAQYLLGSRPFAPISMVRSNPDAVLAVLVESGYATDPAYATRLRALLDQRGLLPSGQSLRSLDRIQF